VVVCIRDHESGDNYAENTGNGYYGAYQDLASTWTAAAETVGAFDGDPYACDYPPPVQDQVNYQVYLSGGWGQWSTSWGCGA
jgi:resuscitation-promoting factor RpfA